MVYKSWQVLDSHSLRITTERYLIKLVESVSQVCLSNIVSQFNYARRNEIICDWARLDRHQKVIFFNIGRILTLFCIDRHLNLTSDHDCVLSDE